MEEKVTGSSERQVFRRYLIPSMLSMLAVSAYSFVDTFVVGQGIGADAVAAMGLGTPVICILYALGFLLGAGGAIHYTFARETGDAERARAIFAVSFWSAVGLWILICVCGNIWINEAADFLGATEGNHALTVEYIRWIISLSGVLILDLVMNNFMRNEGYPNVSMVATVTGTGLNIVLDFVFVLVFHWGMAGAASATCLASVISVTINLSFAVAKHTNLIPSVRRIRIHFLPSILQLGAGSFVLEGAVSIISVVFLKAAGRFYQDAGVSAFSVMITLNLVVYSLINGVAQAIQPLISASFALNERKRMRCFVKYGLTASCALGLLFLCVAELIPVQLVQMFVTNDAEVVNLGGYGLRIYAVSFLFMAVSILLGIYFQSEKQPTKGLIILLGRSAVLPVIALLILMNGIGKNGLWIAIPTGEGAAAIIAVILYIA